MTALPRFAIANTPHLPLLSALYTAQGIPYGFFSLALPVLMREAGWSLTAIGFLQFLALPWAIKFLWAPVVDHTGSRRGWLLSMQLIACAMAVGMAWLDFQVGSIALMVAVFLFNLVAATQDIATDGLAVRLLNAQQRGAANAIQVGAYRLGMILGGGLLLWLSSRFGWPTTFVCMAALLALSTVPVWRMSEPPPHVPERVAEPVVRVLPEAAKAATHRASHLAQVPALLQPPRGKALAMAWLHRLLQPGLLTLTALIFCYRFGDQMVSGLVTPFIRDQGVSREAIALMKGVVGSGASLLGAAMGGWMMLRVGRRSALLISGLAQAAGFCIYVAAALHLGGAPLLWVATVVEGVVGTMATVALYSLMMDAADPAHAGTDYTLLASAGVAVGSLGSIVGGMVGDAFGYVPAFVLGTVLSALGVLALVFWLDRHPVNARVSQAWRRVV